MDQRERRTRTASDIQLQEDYIQSVARLAGSAAEELEKLGALHDEGVLTDEEFATQKAKMLGGACVGGE